MKSFRFSLQSVETGRFRREQDALEAYAAAVLIRAKALEDLRAIEESLAGERSRWQNLATVGCSLSDLEAQAVVCQQLAIIRDAKERAVGKAERTVSARLLEVLAARQQIEAARKLSVRWQRAPDRGEAREEQVSLADMAKSGSFIGFGLQSG